MEERIGELRLNSSNRYEVNGQEYTSGSSIEYRKNSKWVKSSIEHYNGRYYIVGDKNLELHHLIVRY